jgi:hypothetical protein
VCRKLHPHCDEHSGRTSLGIEVQQAIVSASIFATKLNGNDDPSQPSEFKLLVEERRIIESIAGNENLEIQWRLATLKETKAVVTQYHKYLTENSLIRSVSDPEILPPGL